MAPDRSPRSRTRSLLQSCPRPCPCPCPRPCPRPHPLPLTSPSARNPFSPGTNRLNLDFDGPNINPLIHDHLMEFLLHFSTLNNAGSRNKTARCLALLKTAAASLVRHFKFRVVVTYDGDIFHTCLTVCIVTYRVLIPSLSYHLESS
jgi:hypothetical protein